MTLAENSMLNNLSRPPVNASGEYCLEIIVTVDVKVESVEVLLFTLYLDGVFQDVFSLTIIDNDCKNNKA